MKQNATLEEKLDVLLAKLEANEANQKSQRLNSWIIRISGIMITTVCVLVISFMVNISERVAKVESDKMDEAYKSYIADHYLSVNSYGMIENQRAIDLIDFVSFVGREANIREEELEKARTTAIRKMKMYVDLGTSRGN